MALFRCGGSSQGVKMEKVVAVGENGSTFTTSMRSATYAFSLAAGHTYLFEECACNTVRHGAGDYSLQIDGAEVIGYSVNGAYPSSAAAMCMVALFKTTADAQKLTRVYSSGGATSVYASYKVFKLE